MTEFRFEKEYLVHVYETGPDGRLKLYSLFDYLQDIASEHAIMLGFGRDDLMRNNRFWVLSRIYMSINHMPLWGEKIYLTTWPNGTDKLFALRNYEVKSADGTILASGVSSWLILDMTTKKVQRPDSELSGLNVPLQPEKTALRLPEKLEAITDADNLSDLFAVKISDIDVNLHTNNVMYLKWVTDTYDLDFILKNEPVSVEINYLAESKVNEQVQINTSLKDPENLLTDHSVVRMNDNKELCRLRIGWRKVNK
jgi:medium-chain acyl-[acyl-carrier-protein] hydrolase